MEEGPSVDGHPPRLPEGVRVYAIGDVHGRSDLLVQLEAAIEADIAAAPPADSIIVYVGDYVDRGFESAKVLEQLVARPMKRVRSVHLIGNHDVWLREFMNGADVGPSWIQHGGDATLLSYGARLDLSLDEGERMKRARLSLLERVPVSHRRFLERLELAFSIGDYFFCHAGVRPQVPLDQQTDFDLVWIREPFLSHNGELQKVVVHGHTPGDAPVVRRHRIGIDTGACWTGNLTALVLEGIERRFLSTASTPAAPT